MASIEFLQERINKAQETISKKQNTIEKKTALIGKKIAKIEKAGIAYFEGISASDHRDNNEVFWLICEIGTLKEDIRRGSKEIAEKQESLAKYQRDLEKEIGKKNSRNIQIIIDFLNDWKLKTMEFYQSSVSSYLEALEAWWEFDRADTEWFNSHNMTATAEEWKERRALYRAKKKAFNSEWQWISYYMDSEGRYDEDGNWTRVYFLDTQKLQRDIDREADRKYDFIIARTNEIVTEITDASDLHIGDGGELNGNIIGTTGIANVRTIGAGGWNIQRFHFRTLVRRIA